MSGTAVERSIVNRTEPQSLSSLGGSVRTGGTLAKVVASRHKPLVLEGSLPGTRSARLLNIILRLNVTLGLRIIVTLLLVITLGAYSTDIIHNTRSL